MVVAWGVGGGGGDRPDVVNGGYHRRLGSNRWSVVTQPTVVAARWMAVVTPAMAVTSAPATAVAPEAAIRWATTTTGGAVIAKSWLATGASWALLSNGGKV